MLVGNSTLASVALLRETRAIQIIFVGVVFIVLYRIGGAGSKLRKYTIGPYGRVTLHQARVAAQKVFAARLDGRDPAAEKREAKRRVVADRVEDLLEAFIAQRLSKNRSVAEISRLLRREVGKPWAGRERA